MPTDREACTLFAANSDLVLVNKGADVLEADRRFVELHLVVIGESVDEVGGCHGFGHAVLPASRFNQVIKEKRNDIVGLDKCAVAIHDAEAVCVSIGSNADSS